MVWIPYSDSLVSGSDNRTFVASLLNLQKRRPCRWKETSKLLTYCHGDINLSRSVLQIEAYRGVVQFLGMENSYPRGQDLLHEMQALPELRVPPWLSRMPILLLDPSGLSDTNEEDDESDPDDSLNTETKLPPTSCPLATQTNLLPYRDIIKSSASPCVVDLSTTGANRNSFSRRT